jgi:hypothetical protein
MAKTILQFIDSNGPNWSPDWGKNENAQQEFDKRVKSLKDFLEKYKKIHEEFRFSKDISNYFKIDSEEGYIEMLIDTKEILIPENYDNFLSKFFASDVGNNRGAGMGHSPFDDEFYKDLFNIFKDENNEVYTEIYVGVSGNFDGAYEESVSFKEDGLHWEKEEELDFDDGEDVFESHGYCQDCGEELWSSEDDTNISKTREGYCFLCESK